MRLRRRRLVLLAPCYVRDQTSVLHFLWRDWTAGLWYCLACQNPAFKLGLNLRNSVKGLNSCKAEVVNKGLLSPQLWPDVNMLGGTRRWLRRRLFYWLLLPFESSTCDTDWALIHLLKPHVLYFATTWSFRTSTGGRVLHHCSVRFTHNDRAVIWMTGSGCGANPACWYLHVCAREGWTLCT